MIIKVRHYTPILAATMLLSILLFQGWQLTSLLRDREWDYSRNLLHNLSDRAQASLGRRFEENDVAHIGQAMSDIYLFKRETKSFLIDDQNRVITADRLGYDGMAIGRLPIQIDPRQLKAARKTLQGNILVERTKNTLTAYYPVSMAQNGEQPYSRTAVLIITLHVAQGMEEVQDFVAESILNSLALVVLLVTFLTVALHFALSRRVSRMLDVSSRYISGEISARNTDTSPDEIGEIARAFNLVADAVAEKQFGLEKSQEDLSRLNRTLEERVIERTKALEQEVEERARAEDMLRGSEAELETVLNLAPDGIIVINERGIVAKFNHSAERMFGWTEQEITGQNLNCIMPEPHHSAHDSYLQTYHDTGERKVIGREREVEGQRRDGKPFPVALSVSEIQLRGARHYIGVVRDISARKDAEQALSKARDSLLEAEKMAALGGLVAGVAHEINTPVGVGVTAASHLGIEVEAFVSRYKDGTMKRSDLEQLLTTCTDSVEIIESNLVRASQLIRSFKEIAVDQVGDDVREIAIGDYIGQVLTSLRPQLKNRPIETLISVTPPDMRVRLQPGGISQIMTNLVINSLTHAFDAADTGRITFVVTERDGAVDIVYSDDGKGMSKTVRGRIFDPFFTTKRGQGGSGLGMNIVYNLVTQKFGGEIQCDSVPGEGTRFSMTFPECVVGQFKDTGAQ